mmetsp:Transcript_2745/g.9283  ORF Transcript_2745/g.9283 Transcript_2745/m.9283 type:complete len:373 (-) Transcript_2745:212-1330(-)
MYSAPHRVDDGLLGPWAASPYTLHRRPGAPENRDSPPLRQRLGDGRLDASHRALPHGGRQRIQLVGQHHQRAPLREHLLREPQLGLCKPPVFCASRRLLRIDDHQHHVRALHAPLRRHPAQHRRLSERLELAPLHPPGRVHQPHLLPLVQEPRVRRVSREPGLRPGQAPRLPKKGIHQSRLARVRPSEDGELQRLVFLGLGRALRPEAAQIRCDLVHHRLKGLVEVGHALTALCRNCHGLAQPKAVGLPTHSRNLQFPPSAPLALVGHQQHTGRPVAPEPLGGLHVLRDHALARIDYQHRDVAPGDPMASKLHGTLLDRALGGVALEAGVVDRDELEVPQLPHALPVVPGDVAVRGVVHEGVPFLDEPVVQR